MTPATDVLSSEKKQTTAGNYFVANYPPFSFWKRENRHKVEEVLDRKSNLDTPLGLYLHLPFCRKRCHFCYFRVYTGREAKRDRVAAYIEAVLNELKAYARKPLLAGRLPQYVYFGGGTPSFLSPEQLEQLIHGMKSVLPWDRAEEVTFECEPGTLDERKLDVLRELGVTRLSLGVENFSDHVLKSNGRAHLSKEIYRSYDYARSIGFHQINIDLIAGMLNETEENWHSCVAKTAALAPDCVTVYQMEIPFNTAIYQQMHERGDIVAPVADWPTKRAWVAEAFEKLEDSGYTVADAYSAVRNPDEYRFRYREYLWTGADMISLGVSSFGHFRGVHYQNEKDFGPYIDRVAGGELPIHRALEMTEEEKLVREVILQLKFGSLDRAYFQEKFGADIYDRFSRQLGRLRDDGHLAIDGDRVTLRRAGLLAIDELLHDFFLPQHQSARYT